MRGHSLVERNVLQDFPPKHARACSKLSHIAAFVCRKQVLECMRRIMLTGVVVFIYPGDAAQIVISIMFAFIFFAVSEALLPFESASDTWLSRGGHVVVFFTFFAGLLYKVDISDERDTSQQVFAGAIIAVHACLIASVLLNGVLTWFADEKVVDEDAFPRPRNVGTRTTPSRSPGMLCFEVEDGLDQEVHGVWQSNRFRGRSQRECH